MAFPMIAGRQIICVALNPAVDRVLEVTNFRIGQHQPARTITRYPAGKAVNVARALAILDVQCTLTGLIGQEETEYFESQMARSKVQVQMLAIQARTRENITIVDPAAHNETHLRDVGFKVAEKDLMRLKRKLHLLANESAVVIFSGSLPEGISPADLADMAAMCKKAGAMVAVDAAGRALAAAAEIGPWLVKPNLQELAGLAGRELNTADDIIQAARDLLQSVEIVIVTCGSQGGYLLTRNMCLQGTCEVDQDKVVNTVGCGDSLLAGFIAGLHRGYDLPTAYRLGLAAAAANATHLEAANFSKEQAEEFFNIARVQQL